MRSRAKSTSEKKASSSKTLAIKTSTSRVVVAGLRGGSGKTTLSLGLIRALRRRGLKVAAFKKGPDYIDAGWLAAASGGACRNLDPFLIGQGNVVPSFVTHSVGADIAIVEGNRGIFDGMDSKGTLSTAALARNIKAPVVLIVDCTKTTRTIAAMLLGVQQFERGMDLAGVVLNQIAGARHETVIRESIARSLKVPVLGAIPRFKGGEGGENLPERHMGLTPMAEHPGVRRALKRAEDIAEQYVDIDALLRIASTAPSLSARALSLTGPGKAAGAMPHGAPRIGVLRDSAFQFYYPENIEALTALGAEVIELSALAEKKLPPLDALYIGGGFPETHAIALSKNRTFRLSLKKAARDGLPIYAECGGLIYLGKSLRYEGRSHRMAGVLPVSFGLSARPEAHGYTRLRVTRKNPFLKTGTELRGHEFHYSSVTGLQQTQGAYTAFKMQGGAGLSKGRDGLCMHSVLGTYTHVHALGSPEWAQGLIEAACRFQASL